MKALLATLLFCLAINVYSQVKGTVFIENGMSYDKEKVSSFLDSLHNSNDYVLPIDSPTRKRAVVRLRFRSRQINRLQTNNRWVLLSLRRLRKMLSEIRTPTTTVRNFYREKNLQLNYKIFLPFVVEKIG